MKLTNFSFSIVAGVLAAGLLTVLVQAQSTPSKPAQNASLTRTTETKAETDAPMDNDAMRPCHFTLADLRRHITATKWPERELLNDATEGVQLATMQKLAKYWANDYDWRKVEARLEARHSLQLSAQRWHFAAWEQPQFFVSQLRAAFSPLR